jgi:chromosome segregation ATPase
MKVITWVDNDGVMEEYRDGLIGRDGDTDSDAGEDTDEDSMLLNYAYELSVEQKRGDVHSCQLQCLEEKLEKLSEFVCENKLELDLGIQKIRQVKTTASLVAAELSLEQPRVNKLTRNVEILEEEHSLTDNRLGKMEADMGILMANQKKLQKRTKNLKGNLKKTKVYKTNVRKSYANVKEKYESLRLRMKDVGGNNVELLDPLCGALEDLLGCIEDKKETRETNEKKRKSVDP